jgi:cyclopropane-fatty-acyl-phospholipid synthase
MDAWVNDADESAPATMPRLERMLRARLVARLASFSHGQIVLHDALGRVELGAPSDLKVRIEVLDPAFYRALAAQGTVGAGEAYIHGLWNCSDLVALVRLLLRNRDLLDTHCGRGTP